MTSLEIFDMYFVELDGFTQYLTQKSKFADENNPP
jgi:hypothetical protein